MAHVSNPKTYPNLNPAAAIPADRNQIFRLRNFADNYRMDRGKEHGQYVPNSRFVFVTMPDGSTLMHQRFRHPVLADGKPVLYAGEASFNNGRLEWWSNGSGNYRPDPDHALQAGLPMQQFFPFEDILKGKHKQSQLQVAPRFSSGMIPAQAKLASVAGRPWGARFRQSPLSRQL